MRRKRKRRPREEGGIRLGAPYLYWGVRVIPIELLLDPGTLPRVRIKAVGTDEELLVRRDVFLREARL